MKKVLLFLAVFMCACSEGTKDDTRPPDGAVISESFVWTYVLPESASGEVHDLNDRYLSIQFDGQKIDQWNDKESYVKLCDKYNDVSYNDKIVPYYTAALAKEYTAVDVVCNKDIDENHKAGASLNDMIKICAVSYDDFIASGYDPAFHTSETPAEFSDLNMYPSLGELFLSKLLSQIGKDDLRLVRPEMLLYFTKELARGRYEFTITFVASEGDNISFKVVADI